MSFTWNPYRAMLVVLNEDGTYSWQCDSCGGGWREKVDGVAPISDLRKSYDSHVLNSHALTPEDVKGWSAP